MRSRLYTGRVLHARREPVAHRFVYPIYTYVLDLDELSELDRSVTGFGYNRFRLATIRDRDYLQGKGTIKERLFRLLSEHGCEDGVARVELVTMARFLGYAFNPVSFYYCYRDDGTLRCAVAEVNNTFGDRHFYVLKRPKGDARQFPVRYVQEKQFHVSPFNDRTGHYELLFSELGNDMSIGVDLYRDGQLVMEALIQGEAVSLDTRHLWTTSLRYPLTMALTIPRITWQAAKLYFGKRLSVHGRPKPDHPMTIVARPPARWQKWARMAVMRYLSGIRSGHVKILLPDGSERLVGSPSDEPVQTLVIRDSAFFPRVVRGGDIGFGESFMEGEWTSPDVTGLLRLFIANADLLQDRSVGRSPVERVGTRLLHACRRNTRKGSKRNIKAHYDLGNDFYSLFLDPVTMAYSCAVFDQPGLSLADAQRRKFGRIIDQAQLSASDHVLEIGCGWGGFAIEAATRCGCRVTGITVSEAQLELARARVRSAGVEDRVEIVLCDYRDMQGQYEKIVSVEMLEAVGHEYLPMFFQRCDELLKSGGRALLQVITIPDERYEAYRRKPDWIQKHIFPGGMLPSPGVLKAALEGGSGLRVVSESSIGHYYPETLRLWRESFNAAKPALGRLGFDEVFQRKWNYYFHYCEAGFASGYIDDVQWVLAHR